MKKLIFLLFAVMIFYIWADTIEVCGEQSGVWESENTYQVVEYVHVPAGNSLVIEPGVIVQFLGNYEIEVNGTMLAVGTEEDSILFTSGQDEPQVSDWEGVRFMESNSAGSIIDHCRFSYGNQAVYCWNNADIIVMNSWFSNNLISVYFWGSTPVIEDNYFTEAHWGIYMNNTINQAAVRGNSFVDICGGVHLESGSNCLLENNVFSNNENNALDLWEASAEVCNNIFINSNRGLLSSFSSFVFSENLVIDCDTGVFSSGGNGEQVILKNSIIDCDNGIHFSDYTYGPMILNNVFFNNNLCFNSGPVGIMNFSHNLFWENNTDAVGQYLSGVGVINSENINGDPCDAFNNLFMDPLFIDQVNGDYHLSENSPAIDAGINDTAYLDPDGTIGDIGAYYFAQGPEIPRAAFAVDEFFGATPLNVSFQNQSTGDIESYLWDFGDGEVSYDENPIHEYTENGVYSVTLTVSGVGETDVFIREDYIEVMPQIEVSGMQQGEWTAGNTYRIMDNIEVVEGNTLTIEAGTKMRFMGNYSIFVYGTLLALGTETDPIIFTSSSNNPRYADWGGLVFSGESSSSSSLDYVEISFGNVAVYCENSSLIISNCWINDSFEGIDIFDSSAEITNNRISGIRSNTIQISGAGNSIISQNDFYDNQSSVTIGGGATPLITGNSFSNFKFSMIFCRSSFPEICNNTFSNYTNGITCADSYADIHHNVFTYGSHRALKIYQSSDPDIYNNTICNTGIGLYLSDAGTQNIINNIFYGNEAAISSSSFNGNLNHNLFYLNLINFEEAAPVWFGEITTTNMNGDPCDAGYNIFMSPQFEDAQELNYQLSDNSPCIDAGNPDPEYNDPDGTINDIGAFYYQIAGDNEIDDIPASKISVVNYPNPFNPSTVISFTLPGDEFIDLSIYNLKGQKITTLAEKNLEAGIHEFIWDGRNQRSAPVASGIYFYKLQLKSTSESGKLLLLK